MEGAPIAGGFVALVVVLLVMARNKGGAGSEADRAAQADIPRRPNSHGPVSGWGRPGFEVPDDTTGDAGVRPRE